ncbi:MAG: hypothetical protein ABEH35_01985 [Haloarculaceae archaeon]
MERLARSALVVSVLVALLVVPVGGAVGADRIVENIHINPTPDEQGSFESTHSYDLPPRVTKLEITVPSLKEDVTVVETGEFTRTDETTLVWEGGGGTPSFTLRAPAGRTQMNDRSAVEVSDWGFYAAPSTQPRWWYSHGSSPGYTERLTIAGGGYAGDDLGYVGDHTRHQRTVDGVEITVVVAEDADSEDSGDRIAQLLRNATRDFSTGNQYDRATAFVLPAARTDFDATGRSYGTSFWVDDDQTKTHAVDSTVTHEFVHSRVGSFPNGTSAWLTEAFAEYYGAYLILNDGSSTFHDFRAHVTTEEYDPGGTGVVLTDQSSWEGTDADYRKGANVLAALDAKIRKATDGERTLQHVLALRFETDRYNGLQTYADFRRAVVAVSGSESVGNWLDTYAKTEAVPTVPDNPHMYTAGPDRDPDSDALPNKLEQRAGTNPFDPDADDDGMTDGVENRSGIEPLDPDTDDDGLDDGGEREAGLDPTNPDWDDDGLTDGEELERGTDPKSADTDGDGTLDGEDEYPDGGTPTPTATPTPEPTTDTSTDQRVSTPTATPGGTGPGFSALLALGAVVAGAVALARRP